MINYEIIAHVGIGPVKLGMTKAESRAAMAGQARPFRKAAHQEVDAYHNNAFQVFFDEQETVEYIELSCNRTAFTALYKGQDVFSLPADELLALLSNEAAFDSSDQELGYPYVYPDLELAVWRPVLPEDPEDSNGRYFSTIGVGIRGYFSREPRRDRATS